MKIYLLFLLVLTVTSIFSDPSVHLSKDQLQQNYVDALLNYEGMAYASYGEKDGISCSTLARKAMINTAGVSGGARFAIEISPCSSNELKEGCNELLSPVLKADSLLDIDYRQLQKGDVAVIGNGFGVHTMVYIGNETWFHSDPVTKTVGKFDLTDKNSDWLKYKVTIMRWNVFKN